MKFLRNNWFYLAPVLFAVLAITMILFGQGMDPRSRVFTVVFMTLLAHQTEEYVWPGGFPMYWNAGASGERVLYDRYPLNKRNCVLSNVSFWFIYALVIIKPDLYPLGCALAYVGFGQLMMHGVMINKKAGTKYNAGMFTAIVFMIPVGIYYLWFIHANYGVGLSAYLLGIAIMPVLAGLLLGLPQRVMADKDSPYRWNEDEMTRGHVLEKLGIK